MDPFNLHVLSSHSNLTSLCTKYNVDVDSLNVYVRKASLNITNFEFPVNGITHMLNNKPLLENTKNNIIKNLCLKSDSDGKPDSDGKDTLESSLVPAAELKELKELFASNIITQFKQAYQSTGITSWMKSSMQFNIYLYTNYILLYIYNRLSEYLLYTICKYFFNRVN